MSQQPKTETDRLANVIQVLQLGHKTGRLLVERNEGSGLEQGVITFVHGQILQANVNQYQGPDALSWLKSWGNCRFAFSIEPEGEGAGRMPIEPLRPTTHAPTTTPLSAISTGQLPLPDAVTRASNRPGGQRNTTGWLTTPYRTRQIEEGIHLIEKMGLARTHRRLFLLIDGKRSVQELTRLMTQEPAEMQKLLHDLERTGVIQR